MHVLGYKCSNFCSSVNDLASQVAENVIIIIGTVCTTTDCVLFALCICMYVVVNLYLKCP